MKKILMIAVVLLGSAAFSADAYACKSEKAQTCCKAEKCEKSENCDKAAKCQKAQKEASCH